MEVAVTVSRRSGFFRVVFILVETSPAAVVVAVTGTVGTVAPGTAEGHVIMVVRRTLPVKVSFLVGGAFQQEGHFLTRIR